jgi:hypothetical protein
MIKITWYQLLKKISFAVFVLMPFLSNAQIKNFMFIGMDRAQLKNTKYWKPNMFEGVQIAYSWRQLEPQKDTYDFSLIEKDLAILKKQSKKLFIQIQDVSFNMKWNHAPKYLLKDTLYHGGANKQYKFKNNNEADYYEEGWVTRRWDTPVQDRLHKLYRALGKKYDGIIEGINTAETSVIFGSGPLHPPGFSFQRYKAAIIENLTALKQAFPKSTVIVYANFMPGGYRPSEDTALLKVIYEFAWAHNIGVGGPDMFPYKRGQMNNSYGLIRDSYKKVATSLAVQDGNYTYINPKTNKKITAEELYQFAENYLHLTYIFWGTEKPFFKSETLPFLNALKTKS